MEILGPLSGFVFWVLPTLSALMVIGTLTPKDPLPGVRSSWATLVLWSVVAVPSLLQIILPALFDVLHRDATRIADGQVWRLVTSVVVQGGGFNGTTSNLLGLAAVSTAAVAYWGVARTWTVFWFGAVASNLAVFVIHPIGGGNSMADFVVATALTSSVLADRGRRGSTPALALVCGLGVLLCVAVLGLRGNYHVWSCVIGLVIGLLPALRSTKRRKQLWIGSESTVRVASKPTP